MTIIIEKVSIVKYGVNVVYNAPLGQKKVFLPFRQWQAVDQYAKLPHPETRGNWKVPLPDRLRDHAHLGELRDKGLTETVKVPFVTGYYPYGGWRVGQLMDVPYVYTELGLKIRDALPPCPPSDEWPARPKSEPKPKTTVTENQAAILHFIRGERSHTAYALNDPNKEVVCGGWASCGRNRAVGVRDTRIFLKMELVELGVDIDSLELVVRLTTLGALMAEPRKTPR